MKTKEEIIEINKIQKEFYNTKKKNWVTQIWYGLRNGILADVRKKVGIYNSVYDLHKVWLGDLSDKKVLDLGCFSGNYLSVYIAKNAKAYVGIDLSDLAIAKLKKKLVDCKNANVFAVDFLSDQDFQDQDFDIIYAYGVLHHFQNTDVLIQKLNEKLATKGRIICYDPLATSFPIKVLRSLYRPFQSDKDWEWPFTKKTYYNFESHFTILAKHGILGKLKWFFIFNLLPISPKKKQQLAQKWHQYDWETSAKNTAHLFKCMHLTMLMEKK